MAKTVILAILIIVFVLSPLFSFMLDLLGSILDFVFDIIGSLFKPLVICLVIFLIIAWLI